MEFNWDDFKNKKIVVKCNTEEKAKDFLKECEKQGLEWFDGKATSRFYYYDGICYVYKYDGNDYIQYSGEKFYLNSGYEIIEWEIENKIDYDREYNIMEIMELPSEIEIKNQYNMFYKISNNDLYYKEDENKWIKSDVSLRNILNMKFKLVKKDKKVTFQEAIQAYGKEIYCIWKDDDEIEHKSEYCIRNEWEVCITDQNCEYLAPAEMVRGEWYIKED